jgi:hypothetical protein
VNDYSTLDQILHRLVLEPKSVAELLFDIERTLFRGAALRRDAVYVTGLARCGSTSLLRSLHCSGIFASLTYSDMPFVIAPNLWQLMSKAHDGKTGGRERPHGDGIFESRKSPEGLEEVFWRMELGAVYIKKNGLFVHDVPAETVSRLKIYQSLICSRYGSLRYLAKNNNLLLRLRSLAPQTPDSCYLVLFRAPLAHAGSLLRQHKRFSAASGFTQNYMRWLVHHEFGAGHRPFMFHDVSPTVLSPDVVDYWLERWIDAYSFLRNMFRQNPLNTVPVHYERMCDDEVYRKKIFARVGIKSKDATFENRNKTVEGASKALVKRANDIYSELCALADTNSRR